jgi:hypothetical protein
MVVAMEGSAAAVVVVDATDSKVAQTVLAWEAGGEHFSKWV